MTTTQNPINLTSYRPSARQVEKAKEAHPLLLTAALLGTETLTYKQLAVLLGVANPRHIGRILGVVAAYSMDHGLPVVSGYVVRASDDEPGDGWYAPAGLTVDEANLLAHATYTAMSGEALEGVIAGWDEWEPVGYMVA